MLHIVFPPYKIFRPTHYTQYIKHSQVIKYVSVNIVDNKNGDDEI